METIDLRKRDVDNLKLYDLNNDIFNSESKIYVLSEGKWNKPGELFKYLFIRSHSTFANKLFTVSMLNDHRKLLDEDTFIIPDKFVSIDNKISGFTIPLIENNTNLATILNSLDVNPEEKIKYLNELGNILKKLGELKIQGMDLSFGDLHECNFIINHDNDDKLCAVDLDSAYMHTGYPQASHYLVTNPYINQIEGKYHANQFGINIPDKNSDLFCYNMIILNTIAHAKISNLNMNDYYMYVNYLESLGFGEDLIESFKALYDTADNINPSDFLDEINIDRLPEANLGVFKYKKKHNKLK